MRCGVIREPPVFEGPHWFPAKTAAGLAERAEQALGVTSLGGLPSRSPPGRVRPQGA